MARTVLVRLIALVGVVLLLAVALCLFDGEEGLGTDLCLVSLAVGSALALLLLPVAMRLEFTRVEIHPPVFADLSSPPPKV